MGRIELCIIVGNYLYGAVLQDNDDVASKGSDSRGSNLLLLEQFPNKSLLLISANQSAKRHGTCRLTQFKELISLFITSVAIWPTV